MDDLKEIFQSMESIENENIFFEDINEYDKYVDNLDKS